MGRNSKIYPAESIEIAKAILKERSKEINLVLCDLYLPDGNGIQIIKELREYSPEIPSIIITGEASLETAVLAIREGASDYLQKPIDLQLLGHRIEKLLENIRLKQENTELRGRLKNSFSTSKLVGNSPQMSKILSKIEQIAATEVSVLLEGESGTGKEILANMIHENSKRSTKSFVKLNCGALTKSLLEAELFGVERGAYTGAEKSRPGYLEAASGGTLFLDEIGEMDLESQVRLLRFLEEKEVIRIGSTKPIPVDTRVVSATNKNLRESIAERTFREDLYYRLAVVKLKLPSLREREGDIPLLFNHFIVLLNEKYDRSITQLSPELLNFLKNYNWPGNVREFKNLLESMVVLANEGDTLGLSDLPSEYLNVNNIAGKHNSKDISLLKKIIPRVPLELYEQAIIRKNMDLFSDNRLKTAKALGISERTLYRKLALYQNHSRFF